MHEFDQNYIENLREALDEFMDYRILRNMDQAQLEEALGNRIAQLNFLNLSNMSEEEVKHHDEQLARFVEMQEGYANTMAEMKRQTDIFGNFFTSFWQGVVDKVIGILAQLAAMWFIRAILPTSWLAPLLFAKGGISPGTLTPVTNYKAGGIAPGQLIPISSAQMGALFTRPTLATVAETGKPEIVSPEPLMRKIVREEGGRNAAPTNVVVNLSFPNILSAEDLIRNTSRLDEAISRSLKRLKRKGTFRANNLEVNV